MLHTLWKPPNGAWKKKNLIDFLIVQQIVVCAPKECNKAGQTIKVSCCKTTACATHSHPKMFAAHKNFLLACWIFFFFCSCQLFVTAHSFNGRRFSGQQVELFHWQDNGEEKRKNSLQFAAICYEIQRDLHGFIPLAICKAIKLDAERRWRGGKVKVPSQIFPGRTTLRMRNAWPARSCWNKNCINKHFGWHQGTLTLTPLTFPVIPWLRIYGFICLRYFYVRPPNRLRRGFI